MLISGYDPSYLNGVLRGLGGEDRDDRAFGKSLDSNQRDQGAMRKAELAANLILLSPVLAGILIACLLATPLNIFAALTCYAIGLTSLIHAKLFLFRQGVWLSFGPQRLAQAYRRSYWTGYAFIALGVFSNIVALLVIGRFAHWI